MIRNTILSFFGIALLLMGCGAEDKNKEKRRTSTRKLSFESVRGIRYFEVKRRFSSGLSFNEMGFQQEPTWIIQFHSNDSILAWSPQKLKMQGFHLHYDHGDVYNFAKEWFRIKTISKDSLQMQRLNLVKKEISKDIRSDVNITYYSDDYIRKVLKTTAAQLQKPTAADTAYIRLLAAKANRNPTNRDSLLAARQPVKFAALSDMIRVEKLSSVDKLNGKTEAYDYLYPRYRIWITRAYDNFGYEFSVFVDCNGKLTLGSYGNVQPENIAARKKTLEAIINVYLQNLLKITPGSTLGISHASEINLLISGVKGNK